MIIVFISISLLETGPKGNFFKLIFLAFREMSYHIIIMGDRATYQDVGDSAAERESLWEFISNEEELVGMDLIVNIIRRRFARVIRKPYLKKRFDQLMFVASLRLALLQPIAEGDWPNIRIEIMSKIRPNRRINQFLELITQGSVKDAFEAYSGQYVSQKNIRKLTHIRAQYQQVENQAWEPVMVDAFIS